MIFDPYILLMNKVGKGTLFRKLTAGQFGLRHFHKESKMNQSSVMEEQQCSPQCDHPALGRRCDSIHGQSCATLYCAPQLVALLYLYHPLTRGHVKVAYMEGNLEIVWTMCHLLIQIQNRLWKIWLPSRTTMIILNLVINTFWFNMSTKMNTKRLAHENFTERNGFYL